MQAHYFVMRNLFFLLVCFFLCTPRVEAVTVKSVQDGSFFTPATWENNQVPNLSADSIGIEHHLRFDQDLNVSGSAYLNIKFCASLCGNFELSVGQNAMIYNQGEIFCGDVGVQAYFLNNGNVNCTGLAVTAGLFENGQFGYLTAHKVIHDCTKTVLPKTFFRIKNIANNVVVVYLQCYSEIDFGDGSGIAHASDSIIHSYSSSDSFAVNIKVYCDCDSATYQQKISITVPRSDTTKECPVFSLFPNPNNGDFRVRYLSCKPQSNLLRVPLYNSAGQRIYSIYLNQNGETHIDDLLNVASGVYYLAMPSSSGIKPQKVVIIK